MSELKSIFTCRLHPANSISSMCLHNNCNSRVLCQKCTISHEAHHQPYIQRFSLSFMKEYESELFKLNQISEASESDYSRKITEIENAYIDLENRILQLLKKSKQELIARVIKEEVKIPNEVLNFKYEFSRFEKNINENYSMEDIKISIDRLAAFKTKTNKILREHAQDSSDTITSKEDIDLTFSSIQPLINRFNKYFYQPKEVTPEANQINFKTLKLDKYLEGTGESLPRSIEFIPQRKLFVVGDKQGILTIWDIKKSSKYHTRNAHSGYINNLKYYPKRDWLISASSDGTIKIWSFAFGPSLKLIQNIKASDKYIWGLLPVEKSSILYSCGGEANIKLWNLSTFKPIGVIDTNGKERMGRDIVYIEKHNMIVVGFQQGVIGLYDSIKRCEIGIVQTNTNVIISCLVYLERHDYLVGGTDLDGKITLWKVKENPESLYPDIEHFKDFKLGGTYAENMVPINNQEQLLVATGNSGKLRVFNINRESVTTTSNSKIADCVTFGICSQEKKLILGDYKSTKLAVMSF